MKSLLFVHHSLVLGGAERILVNYLNLFAQSSDHQVSLALHYPIDDSPYLAEISPKVEVFYLLDADEYHSFLPNQALASEPSFRQLLCDKMADRLANQPVDCIVNFNTHFDFFLERYRVSVPVVRWVHGLLHLNLWLDNQDYYRFILQRHTAIITLNDEMHRLTNQILKKSQQLPTQQADAALLAQPFLLQVGRLESGKNQQMLIDIFATLKQRGLPHKLYILGDGELRDTLQAHIIAKGLQNDCLLLGERHNPYPFMRQASLFLHTSLAEGLPTVLIKSMACGTPMVAMHCQTGVLDILNKGKYGVLIRLHDTANFVQAVETLLADPDILAHYQERLPMAVSRFDLSTVWQDALSLFDHLLNRPSPA